MVHKKATRFRDRARETASEDDRISRLPDDVIHHIFSFIDTRFSVQSSLLSSRWKNTWKSHPYLNFKIKHPADHATGSRFAQFVHRFLSARNDNAEIFAINVQSNYIPQRILKEIITYAISHRTQKLSIEFVGARQTRRGGFDFSLLRSQFLQHLCLSNYFRVLETQTLTWDLPALTTLNLKGVTFTSCLHDDGTSESIELFSRFSNLKSLILNDCRFLHIDALIIISRGLENLTMIGLYHRCDFVISAPKLSSFTYKGIAPFPLSAMDLHSLETVKFFTLYYRVMQKQPELVESIINTLCELSKAKSLTLNSDTLSFLSDFPELLESQCCPFVSLQSLTLVLHQLPSSLTVFGDVLNYFRSSSPTLTVTVEVDTASCPCLYADCDC